MRSDAPIIWHNLGCGACGSVMEVHRIDTRSQGYVGLTECVNRSCSVYGRIVLFHPERVAIIGQIGRSAAFEPMDGPSRQTITNLGGLNG